MKTCILNPQKLNNNNIMLIDEYKALTSRNDFYSDKAQLEAIDFFEQIYSNISGEKKISGSLFNNVVLNAFKKEKSPQTLGLYLWGGVGRGKTFLMDLFFNKLPIKNKKRIHFHRFMNETHELLKNYKNTEDPLKKIAKDISKKTKVLCFDEFFVNDIGDAMILSNLLKYLFHFNVIIIFTSNTEPKNLYKDGLQRVKFLPAIELIGNYTNIVHLKDGQDYRLLKIKSSNLYFTPCSEDNDQEMQLYFNSIAPDWFNWFTRKPVFQGSYIEINHRKISIRFISNNTVWFDFDNLCGDGRSIDDYIEIAKIYENVFISNIPVLDDNQKDSARRFINMIDEFYDRKVKIILSADALIEKLCKVTKLESEFKRTESRINEMQQEKYIQMEHRT